MEGKKERERERGEGGSGPQKQKIRFRYFGGNNLWLIGIPLINSV